MTHYLLMFCQGFFEKKVKQQLHLTDNQDNKM